MITKFGELISLNKPVLIYFYSDWEEVVERSKETLKQIASELGDKVKVIKIDIKKNEILADALKVEKENHTFMIYKNEEMKWRQTGEQDTETLISLIEKYS